LEKKDEEKIIHGKPIHHLLDESALKFPAFVSPFAPYKISPEISAAALFCGGVFAGIVEKRDGKWCYGYVYARP
jgi:hypothetical protein